MKKSTGKPPRKPNTKVQAAAPLGPFDPQLRYTVKQTMAYLSASRPTVYKLINAGLLEAFKEGRRTYITGRSIAARSAPTLPQPFVPSRSNSAKNLPVDKGRARTAPTKNPRRQTRLDDASSLSSV